MAFMGILLVNLLLGAIAIGLVCFVLGLIGFGIVSLIGGVALAANGSVTESKKKKKIGTILIIIACIILAPAAFAVFKIVSFIMAAAVII